MSARGIEFVREVTALECGLRALEVHAFAPLARVYASEPKDYRGSAYGVWRRRCLEVTDQVVAALTTHGGATINAGTGDVTRIRLAGITSSSTQGLNGALRNWKTAAEKRLKALRSFDKLRTQGERERAK